MAPPSVLAMFLWNEEFEIVALQRSRLRAPPLPMSALFVKKLQFEMKREAHSCAVITPPAAVVVKFWRTRDERDTLLAFIDRMKEPDGPIGWLMTVNPEATGEITTLA